MILQINQTNNNTSRRILYVDASFNNETKESKISLYDQKIDRVDTLLVKNLKNSSEAEKSAILYACLYSKKLDILNKRIHILNDNYNATKDDKILFICQYFNITISWIPREINLVADNGTKLEVNIKLEDSNILELFYDIIINKCILMNEALNIETSDKRRDILKNAIKYSTVENKPYASIGQVGNYIKDNNPGFEYTSLKKEIEKYENDFIIIDGDNVKLKI